MRIYVASSWRNNEQQAIVALLREQRHEVYDFHFPHLGPGKGGTGFKWSEIDAAWQDWTPEQYRDALTHHVAVDGFESDLAGMQWADACVLVTPSGRSAHLEAGWMAGAGKPVIVLLRPGEPELMYGLLTVLCTTHEEMCEALDAAELSVAGAEREAWGPA